MKRTCSWCHRENEMTGCPVLCQCCGHRADVGRMRCDCPGCKPPRVVLPPERKASVFDLKQWKQDWRENADEAAYNTSADGGYSSAVAARCRNVERLLLLDLVQHLARLPTSPADLFDRPELVQLQEAARLVGG